MSSSGGGADTRFRKGKSGNPNGRPPRKAAAASAFDIIMDRTLSVVDGGSVRQLTIEEALQLKTVEKAIAGNHSATRQALAMIIERDRAIAARRPARNRIALVHEGPDPETTDEVLLLLGIATRSADADQGGSGRDRLLLEPWAVALALRRGRGKRLEKLAVERIRRCTRGGADLALPEAAPA